MLIYLCGLPIGGVIIAFRASISFISGSRRHIRHTMCVLLQVEQGDSSLTMLAPLGAARKKPGGQDFLVSQCCTMRSSLRRRTLRRRFVLQGVKTDISAMTSSSLMPAAPKLRSAHLQAAKPCILGSFVPTMKGVWDSALQACLKRLSMKPEWPRESRSL